MTTSVYIDGFNLYNGSLRKTQYKWLNILAMCETLLPGRQINRIRYFTARVIAFSHDLQAPARQDTYLRALKTLPNLVVHEDGWFASHPVNLPRYPLNYPSPNGPPEFVRVLRMEEKRTDVDLATHLLVDSFSGAFDEAVVISNDSDLVLPIQMVRSTMNKVVGVINPHPPNGMSGHLKRAASYYLRTINKSVLASSQFPPSLIDADGRTITKPASW
ncbi:MAG: hypothetical protein BZY73_01535 [SAR202 cluster bacterium Casp-Chloro-G3]|nr:MAG: hypothetical protein BZY73_01535 [SAR202 cluster bacterium Casp-Chloro-G3]